MINIYYMALGSIKKAYDTFKQHDFSRSFQLRILGMNNVPDYVQRELITQEGRLYATSYVVPGRSIQNIDVPFQGFQFKLPGQVAYDSPNPWQITFRTAGDYLARNALERWSFETANDETSCGRFNLPCENTTIDIAVLSPKCEIIRVYRLHGVYIQNVSQIDYNQENSEGTTFTAAFHYQYWRPAGGYDTGLVDSTNVNNGIVDGVFATYESKIQQSTGECPPVNIPRL
jgi:hypothetical protein